MNELVGFNRAVYLAMLIGGFVLGTMFGRSLAGDLAAAIKAIETRIASIETALHLRSASITASPAHAAAAHSASASSTSSTSASAVKPASK